MFNWLLSHRHTKKEAMPPEEAIERGQAVVLELLEQLKLDPHECQVQPYEWVIQKGNATVYVSIQVAFDPPHLLVYSPLFSLPEENILPLYRHLLEFNNFHYSGPAKFSVKDDWIILSRFTKLEYLTLESALEILIHLANLADERTVTLHDEFFKDQVLPEVPPVYDE